MSSLFGEQESDFERAINNYKNNAGSVAQNAIGGYTSVEQGKQSLTEAGATAESSIDTSQIEAKMKEEGTKFMKEMGVDFSTPTTLKGVASLSKWAGKKLLDSNKANAYGGPQESLGADEPGNLGQGTPGQGDLYRTEQYGEPGAGGGGDGPPAGVRGGEPPPEAPPGADGGEDGGGEPDLGGEAPPAPAPEPPPAPAPEPTGPEPPPPPAETDPGSIPGTGASDPAPQTGTMQDQMSEQFTRIRGGDVPEAGEQMSAMAEGRIARTPGQISEYKAKVDDYNTRNNPLAEEEPQAPETDGGGGGGGGADSEAASVPRPQARQAEVPEDADFGSPGGWQMTEPATEYQSSTEMKGPTDEPDTFTTTQVTEPGEVPGPQLGETGFGEEAGNFTGRARSMTGTRITQRDPKPTDTDPTGPATDVEAGAEGQFRLPTTEWEGPIPAPARAAGPADQTQAPEPEAPTGGGGAGGAGGEANSVEQTLQRTESAATTDAGNIANDAANTTRNMTGDIDQTIANTTEETSSIAATLTEAGGSFLSTAGGFIGDLIPFLAPIAAGWGLESGLKDMNKAYGSEGTDPYAAVRTELAAGQAKVGAMGAAISADQFASKVGGAAPAFGSLAAPTFSTAQQMGGATGHF